MPKRLRLTIFNIDNQIYNIYNLKYQNICFLFFIIDMYQYFTGYYNCKKLFLIFVVYFCNPHAGNSSKFI